MSQSVEVVTCTRSQAEKITKQFREAVGRVETAFNVVVSIAIDAYALRVWEPLGYSTWDAYCAAEVDTAAARIPRELRVEIVGQMTEAGMSTRAIGAAVGVSHETVSNDQRAGVKKLTPAKPLARTTVQPNFKAGTVKGTDGKTYPSKVAAPKTTPSRKPLTDAVDSAGWELRRSAERLQRLSEDDRWAATKEKVAGHLTNHLRYVVGICEELLDNL